MHLVVVGDTLLDVDLFGTVSRVCPDAPVPVVDLEHRVQRAGGAGLTAAFAAGDGLAVTLVTAVADDEAGQRLRAEFRGYDTVIGPARAGTPVKTRLRSAGQSIARIDEGGRGEPPVATDAMLDAVCAADAVLVSDYGRGLTEDERLRALLARLATRMTGGVGPASEGDAAGGARGAGVPQPGGGTSVLRHHRRSGRRPRPASALVGRRGRGDHGRRRRRTRRRRHPPYVLGAIRDSGRLVRRG